MPDDTPVMVLARNLGARLAAYRLSRNLRQEDIAAAAGLSRGAVVRLESGAGGSVDSLLRVMKALGLADRIALLAPDAHQSPLEARDAPGLRQRARPPGDTGDTPDTPWTWGS